MSRREYKTVAMPQLHRARRRRGKSHAEVVAEMVTTAINQQAALGWRYVGADSFHTKERRGLLGVPYDVDHTLLVFDRDSDGAALPEEPELAPETEARPRRAGLGSGRDRRESTRQEPPPTRQEAAARQERPIERQERPTERHERPTERHERPVERRRVEEPLESGERRPPARPFQRTREAVEPDFDDLDPPRGPEGRDGQGRPRPRGAGGAPPPPRGRRTRY